MIFQIIIIPMSSDHSESAPVEATIAEIQRLRADFKKLVESYALRVDGQFAGVLAKLKDLSCREKLPGSLNRDLRDMLTLLRNTQVKIEKSRRKDLKKIETIAEDLSMLTESW